MGPGREAERVAPTCELAANCYSGAHVERWGIPDPKGALSGMVGGTWLEPGTFCRVKQR